MSSPVSAGSAAAQPTYQGTHETKSAGDSKGQEPQQSSIVTDMIGGKMYAIKDGKPFKRIKIGAPISPELIAAQQQLSQEKIDLQMKAAQLDKSRKAISIEYEAITKEGTRLEADRKKLEEDKQKLALDQKEVDQLKAKLDAKRTELTVLQQDQKDKKISSEEFKSEIAKGMGIKNEHDAKFAELNAKIKQYNTDFANVNKSVEMYNIKYPDVIKRMTQSTAQIEEFEKEASQYKQKSDDLDKKMKASEDAQKLVAVKDLGNWKVIFIEPDRMLMSIPCYKKHAMKTGVIEEISWVDKCVLEGDKNMVFKNIRCLASSKFDDFLKKHLFYYYHKLDLYEFIQEAEKETTALRAKKDDCIIC
ncbi:MAG: hypothetical protein H0W88_00005 [Parachlamydiaceae bacterium]|nr:hypothetical protein [Parachlamydiaceae bacterium]